MKNQLHAYINERKRESPIELSEMPDKCAVGAASAKLGGSRAVGLNAEIALPLKRKRRGFELPVLYRGTLVSVRASPTRSGVFPDPGPGVLSPTISAIVTSLCTTEKING